MHEIMTDIEIESTPEDVWKILVDFAAYTNWNPFIRSIEGRAKKGELLKVSIQPVDGKLLAFRPTVLIATPSKELRWLGRFLFPGIFDGEHYFRIEPISSNRVKFIQGERFSGLLVAFAKSSLDIGTQRGFVAMNQALKNLAENRKDP